MLPFGTLAVAADRPASSEKSFEATSFLDLLSAGGAGAFYKIQRLLLNKLPDTLIVPIFACCDL